MRTSAVVVAFLLSLPAAAAAGDLPRFGDYTFGFGLAGTAQPLEPGSPDTLLSPALTADFNLLTPIFLSGGVHGRVDALGPAIGWDVALAGFIGGGASLHGNGRTSADVFVGLPIPLNDDGWYLSLYGRGGPYLDASPSGMTEGYVMLGLEVKYSSWWDRVADDDRPRKKKVKKDRQPKKKEKPSPRPSPKPAPKPKKRH